MRREYQPGSLVKLRNRDWVVMPSADKNLLMVKPLGGAEDETTGIYLPLRLPDEIPETAEFPYPSSDDIGNFSSAKILYNATRLSFRNVAGPFRSLGKLSFRPKSYQIVPLIMALRQETIRLLIADDVGVGKTIEALVIVREMLDRGEIKTFAVVCPPHLCDQWQREIKDKFSMDAVIVRSSTAAQLDRKIRGDESIFKSFPCQVISIDFIKSDSRRSVFLNDCPDIVIVDEAHTCTNPADERNVKQQQRFFLVHEISKREKQNLILLTATPHSGKQSQFQSLLGLIKQDYSKIDLVQSGQNTRKEVANHLIIRRRADVAKFYEDTTFPEREQGEIAYELSDEYMEVFEGLLSFARGIDLSDQKLTARRKFQYFAILSLFRGVMSSPQAGIEMLARKTAKMQTEDYGLNDDSIENPVADSNEADVDTLPSNLLEKIGLKAGEINLLNSLSSKLENIKDNKADAALTTVKQWLKEGFNPVVFCRFIPTAKYVGGYFKVKLPSDVETLIITGEMVDEERKQKIDEFGKSKKKKVLIATDCLSEGINLQKHFNAVLHYDLVWNPNKLEQREGRVDRYGQTAKKVKTYLLYGKDNPIDSVVLNVLLLKAREIRRQTGISVPFPEDSQNILDSLINAVLLSPAAAKASAQLSLDFAKDEINSRTVEVTNVYQEAAERDKATRSIFAQHSIKVNEIEKDLKQSDEAIGDPEAVRHFVMNTVTALGAQVKKVSDGYILYTTNLPGVLKPVFAGEDEVYISFISPTPEDFEYIGRNHPFVEQLCRYVLNNAVSDSAKNKPASRASVIASEMVDEKTTILLMRVRNIISDKNIGRELVAEEIFVWGYKGSAPEGKVLSYSEAMALIENAHPASDLSPQRRADEFEKESRAIKNLDDVLKKIVESRSLELIDAHERFRKLVSGGRYKIVEPVLPPDILGVYVLLPVVK